MHGNTKRTLTPRQRHKLQVRVARARREAERVAAIVNQREANDIARMMRENRAGGF